MRTIAIVGTGSGIGQALAELLSRQSDVEMVAFSRSQPFVPVKKYIPFDILADGEMPPFEGSLDGLVYCPGSIQLKSFETLGLKDFRADMEINFFGAVRVLKHLQKALKRSGKASVVLFSSVAAATGMPYHASIGSAKGAVEGLVRALAAEMAPVVRVNGIAPSLVNTKLAERLVNTEAKLASAAERHAMKRIGSAAEIAEMAAFLLSEKSSWITGQVFAVDGGMSSLRI